MNRENNLFLSDAIPEIEIDRAVISDIEQFNQYFPAANQQIDQIDGGPVNGRMSVVKIGKLIITSSAGDRRLYARGCIGNGLCSFGTVHSENQQSRWQGRQHASGFVSYLPAGKEFNHLTSPSFHTTAIIFPEEWMNQLSAVYFDRDFSIPRIGMRLGSDVCWQFDQTLDKLIRQLGDPALDHHTGPALLSTTRNFVKRMIEPETIGETILSSSRRRRIVLDALDIVNVSLDKPLTLLDLCRMLDVSERTLLYSFKSTLGISPAQFVRSVRLNHLRRNIRESNKQKSVSAIFEDHGFRYSGQFAAVYKNHFGELPSETPIVHA